MKHHTDYLTFETPNRRDYINITDRVEEFVRESGIQHGLCLVNPMHITAAVYVNDAETGLIQDIDDWLERLAPHEPVSSYRHNRGEDNADAHLKRHLMSHQVVLPITDGRLDLGPWEQVYYAEFDGRRRKRLVHEGDRRVARSVALGRRDDGAEADVGELRRRRRARGGQAQRLAVLAEDAPPRALAAPVLRPPDLVAGELEALLLAGVARAGHRRDRPDDRAARLVAEVTRSTPFLSTTRRT